MTRHRPRPPVPRFGALVLAVALLAGAVLVGDAAAAPAPRVVAGWPKHVAAGPVLPGPGGGIVVVTKDGPPGRGYQAVYAFARDGRRLWVNRTSFDCGICDFDTVAPVLQPDGTYGHLGIGGYKAVDARGGTVPGCVGVVTAEGLCYLADPWDGMPALAARTPAGETLWSVGAFEERTSLYPTALPPVAVRDAAGLLYAGFGPGYPPTAYGQRAPGRLLAVDPTSRARLWVLPGTYDIVTNLGDGVLTVHDGRLTAISSAGTERWSHPLRPSRSVPGRGDRGYGDLSAVAYDRARDRVYLGHLDRAGRPAVTAYVASTGAVAWRTRAADAARLLSVGRSGRVYLAVATAGFRGVRAARIADGKPVWEQRTAMPVLGAAELGDGSVAVSSGLVAGRWGTETTGLPRFGPGPRDRLILLRPALGGARR